MSKPALDEAPRCGNCGIEIPWTPVVHQGMQFCCGGCAQGGPCYCSYDLASVGGARPAANARQVIDRRPSVATVERSAPSQVA
jgi:hypothetical protein